MRPWVSRLILTVVLVALAAPVQASTESEALQARAANALYNLDRDQALELYRLAVAADPSDAGAFRGLATALWLSVTFGRGTMTVDSYLGRISSDDVELPPVPDALADEFHHAVDRAIALARERLHADPRDADAHYQLGAAVGLRASYAATILGSVRKAFGAAREAYNAHERVLELSPSRHDAGLVVGTYRYLVAAMSLPMRMVAYVAGFGGGRERGIELVERAAAYEGDNRADARVALVLLYNRERRYDAALKHLARLRADFPRNRLLWLESGATALRAGRKADADAFLTEGIARLERDGRPRMFGEEALWFLKRGTARAALGRDLDAEQDLRRARSLAAPGWVRARTHLALGKISLKKRDRMAAAAFLRAAVAEAEKDRDAQTADEAKRLLR